MSRFKSLLFAFPGTLVALTSLAQAEVISCKPGETIDPARLASPPRQVFLVSSPHPCVLKGKLELSSGASLLLLGSGSFRIDGSIVLRGTSSLTVMNTRLNIANHYVFEHSIRATESSRFALYNVKLETNAGDLPTSLAANYLGTGKSSFIASGVSIDPLKSWLLATVSDQATLSTTDSKDVPTEIYPSGESTVKVSGPKSQSAVWLDFSAGAVARLERLPSLAQPMNFSFGRNTPALTNVKYQIDVVNGFAGIGVQSHPGSKVTVRENQQYLMLNYFVEGSGAPPVLVGPKPGVRQTISLSDSTRTLELVDALMFPFGWQVYASGNSASPAVFDGSIINEMGALAGGLMIARRSLFNLAVIASMGGGSEVSIMHSPSIESQSILAEGDGKIHISDSVLFGSLVQARGDSTILLTNNTLAKNRRNPFNPPDAPVTFKVDPASKARIVVAAIQGVSNGVIRGDAFIEGRGSSSCTYALSYRKADSATSLPLGTKQPCGKRSQSGDTLGSIYALARGNYLLELTLEVQGVPFISVLRPFTVQ